MNLSLGLWLWSSYTYSLSSESLDKEKSWIIDQRRKKDLHRKTLNKAMLSNGGRSTWFSFLSNLRPQTFNRVVKGTKLTKEYFKSLNLSIVKEVKYDIFKVVFYLWSDLRVQGQHQTWVEPKIKLSNQVKLFQTPERHCGTFCVLSHLS
jgi:hypothetical protein